MVSRDYKQARARRDGFSGWAGLLIGLAAGLAVGFGFYWFEPRTPAVPAEGQAPVPASTREAPAGESEERYTYYDVLPNFEVVVPEREAPAQRNAPAASVARAGSYVLQVGSYRKFEDADRVRAQLALQGIESKVQRVSVDNDTWHRVRVGPVSDLKELNRVRDRLREAEMDVLVIRVGD